MVHIVGQRSPYWFISDILEFFKNCQSNLKKLISNLFVITKDLIEYIQEELLGVSQILVHIVGQRSSYWLISNFLEFLKSFQRYLKKLIAKVGTMFLSSQRIWLNIYERNDWKFLSYWFILLVKGHHTDLFRISLSFLRAVKGI